MGLEFCVDLAIWDDFFAASILPRPTSLSSLYPKTPNCYHPICSLYKDWPWWKFRGACVAVLCASSSHCGGTLKPKAFWLQGNEGMGKTMAIELLCISWDHIQIQVDP